MQTLPSGLHDNYANISFNKNGKKKKKKTTHKSVPRSELPLLGKAGISGIDVTGIETKLASSTTSQSRTIACLRAQLCK